MIELPEHLVIVASVIVFVLGALFGVGWHLLMKRKFPEKRDHSCPHCGSADLLYATDWSAEPVDRDEMHSDVISEYQCQDCHRSHWI